MTCYLFAMLEAACELLNPHKAQNNKTTCRIRTPLTALISEEPSQGCQAAIRAAESAGPSAARARSNAATARARRPSSKGGLPWIWQVTRF